ncbi:unnamed protein product [Phytophthora fragariaefolia]|uniref:Unnamed protein product n=1 Tax=Phytophthora fragariaefolia TaxID=1490495 RepID=A0A9W6Y2L4_9STRA|nr:unnamed protein product [Phytophthora fragariaefolia]
MYRFYGLDLGNYISHAHAWSTGPTASLTLHVGGLSPVMDAGKTWEFVPHVAGADVGELHTGYTLATGDFSVEWTTKDEDNIFLAHLETPQNTTGSISVPTFGKSLDSIEISINGNTVWSKGSSSWDGFGVAIGLEDFVTVSAVPFGGRAVWRLVYHRGQGRVVFRLDCEQATVSPPKSEPPQMM